MAEITRETILQALGGVRKTDGGQDVVQFVGDPQGFVARDATGCEQGTEGLLIGEFDTLK